MTTVTTTLNIAKILVPGPFYQGFDYIIADEVIGSIAPGVRVEVPFGRRKLVGIVQCLQQQSDFAKSKLKTIVSVIDQAPILPESIYQLVQWGANYYHYPLGDALMSALPKLLREGRSLSSFEKKSYQITPNAREALSNQKVRGKKQLDYLQQLLNKNLPSCEIESTVRKNLLSKKWIEQVAAKPSQHCQIQTTNEHLLNQEQQYALKKINAATDFKAFVLAGITGSGKTEVYLQAISHILKKNKNALVLVPEIALTPQTVSRFQNRFDTTIVTLHSKLSDGEKMQAWLSASSGEARIIIGTRSALFAPIPNLGIIIIDEEHDSSFKQQSGFRYHARDLSIVYAKQQNIPIILGSATPSLELIQNTKTKNFELLKLTERPGGSVLPTIKLIDLRAQKTIVGMTATLQQAMQQQLEAGHQVMVFLNRRGYCPVLMCHHCGYSVSCPHCDMKLVFHAHHHIARCHHCGYQQNMLKQCPSCRHDQILQVGQGTERIAEQLQKKFPDYTVLRIDSDSTQRKQSFNQMLQQVHNNEAQILVGTQMLAKGHHFPNLTLVAMLDADYGLYSNDFHALESMCQLIMQVAGRAGREKNPGLVYLQTHLPHHPALNQLLTADYLAFADTLLQQRQENQLPPFVPMAVFVAEDAVAHKAEQLLRNLQRSNTIKEIEVMGPVPAAIAKRAGRYRFQLLLRGPNRRLLHHALRQAIIWLNADPQARRVKWFLDVDPIEL